MSQLTVCHSAAIQDATHDMGAAKCLDKQTGNLILICFDWHVLFFFFFYFVYVVLNMPVIYAARRAWGQSVENVGGQSVLRGPAVHLHLPQYLQHMSGSLSMVQCPGACWAGK